MNVAGKEHAMKSTKRSEGSPNLRKSVGVKVAAYDASPGMQHIVQGSMQCIPELLSGSALYVHKNVVNRVSRRLFTLPVGRAHTNARRLIGNGHLMPPIDLNLTFLLKFFDR